MFIFILLHLQTLLQVFHKIKLHWVLILILLFNMSCCLSQSLFHLVALDIFSLRIKFIKSIQFHFQRIMSLGWKHTPIFLHHFRFILDFSHQFFGFQLVLSFEVFPFLLTLSLFFVQLGMWHRCYFQALTFNFLRISRSDFGKQLRSALFLSLG